MFFLLENLRLGVRNLWLHRTRSLLTALGIIIGTATVIVMVALGQGAKRQALEQMERLGPTNVVVRSVRPPETADSTAQTDRQLTYGLTRADLAKLETVPNVVKLVPLRESEQQVSREAQRQPGVSAVATTPDWFDVVSLSAARGALFDWGQHDRGDAVCVLGHEAALALFPQGDPIGQEIKLGSGASGSAVLTVVGVLEPSGLRADGGAPKNANQGAANGGGGPGGNSVLSRDIDFDLYFPMQFSRVQFGDRIVRRTSSSMERKVIELSEVWLRARDIATVERVAGVASNVVGLPARRDASVRAPIQLLRAAEQQQRQLTVFLVSVAGVSLLVGGIGIMNIMLASVTERTKEIGVRRALGAKQRHVALQFLVETASISLLGGLTGITLGVAISLAYPFVVERLTDNVSRTELNPLSLAVSFAVSGLIGVGFGMYPALKAAQMDPIEALRSE